MGITVLFLGCLRCSVVRSCAGLYNINVGIVVFISDLYSIQT